MKTAPARVCTPLLAAGAVLGFARLPSVLPAADLACSAEMVIYEDDCVRLTALGVSHSGSSIQVSGLEAEVKNGCSLITGVKVITYRDRDGRRGFIAPPDQKVGEVQAQAGRPTGSLSVGAFSNQDPVAGTATDWEFVIDHADGQETRGYGTFSL
ncbi:MAG: hypothetical protein D6702_08995 [Planctomycetota bacterium]|nr:MAG: hypothetical protein D6702_08995 [Planctomycetota bacterium]